MSGSLLLTATGAAPGANGPRTAGRAPLSAAQLQRNAMVALMQSRIKYVFVLYQENRSFDSYFGTFPGADGIYSQSPALTPGFYQKILNTDGATTSIVTPFRIGPNEYAADTDDVNHAHPVLIKKMDVVNGFPQMDGFALGEQQAQAAQGALVAKQLGELTMAYEDCDTIPLLWNYANRFTLFDHIFQSAVAPSTPGNLTVIGAQSGETQYGLHPGQAYTGNGGSGPGVPIMNDANPAWGPGAGTQYNLTFATLPLTLSANSFASIHATDPSAASDLADLGADETYLKPSRANYGWGWYENGYVSATSSTGAYIAHHNGPQYFGYLANSSERANLHGLPNFFSDVQNGTLPPGGGVFYAKGGFNNILGLNQVYPGYPGTWNGDDDHPGYSDAQISEAQVAAEVNAIASSKYWNQSAIVITWDDSEGDYDHVIPPLRSIGPGTGNAPADFITEGPRVPLIVISPYSKTHQVVHTYGSQSSIVSLVDTLFGLTPLAQLPDEIAGGQAAAALGKPNYYPTDGPGVDNLMDAFDFARFRGQLPLIPPSYVLVPNSYITTLPQTSGLGCAQIGVTPVNYLRGIGNTIPADFSPRPEEDAAAAAGRRIPSARASVERAKDPED